MPTKILAQKATSDKKQSFSISIQTTGKEVKLICNNGCAWRELSYSISDKESIQAIDHYGMTTLPNKNNTKNSKLTSFLFTIIPSKDGIFLIGIKGTSWLKLQFDCSNEKCTQLIDENGMSTPNTEVINKKAKR